MPKEILKNENKTEDKKDDKLMPSSSINKQGKISYENLLI